MGRKYRFSFNIVVDALMTDCISAGLDTEHTYKGETY